MAAYRTDRRRRRYRSVRRGAKTRKSQPQKTNWLQNFLALIKKLFGWKASRGPIYNNGSSHRYVSNGTTSAQEVQRNARRTGRSSVTTCAAADSPSKTLDKAATFPATANQRKPEFLEVTSPRLYVGNLAYDITESDLFELFSQAAPVKNVEIARDRNNDKSKGFGFVEFATVEDARIAQAKLNQYELAGRQLFVCGAKAPSSRRSSTTISTPPQPDTAGKPNTETLRTANQEENSSQNTTSQP